MRRVAVRLVRGIQRVPERVLHKRRRAQAIAMLRAHPSPMRILFVCYGNICRSPYAQYAFSRLVSERQGFTVASAGFIGPGRSSPQSAQSTAAARGVDLAPHVSQTLSPDLVSSFDVIVVMERAQREMIARQYGARDRILILGDLDPQPIETRTILDPYNRDKAVFTEVYDRIDRCLKQFAASI
jgi:protein-tyrosine phosphatase